MSYYVKEEKRSLKCREAFIIIDEEFCNELKFTEVDIFGALAHEFGHFICLYLNLPEEANEELYSDGFADKLGLKEQLLSALRKMQISRRFSSEIKNQLKNREQWLGKSYYKNYLI